MKNKKYNAAYILVLAVIILLMCGLIACAGPSEESNKKTPDEDSQAAAQSEEAAAPEKILPDVPEKDYDGYEFVILANSEEFTKHWQSRDIYAEEQTGEPINDAVYFRNRAVEEKFNIKINGAFPRDPPSAAKTSIMAGDDLYDMFSIMMGRVAPLAQEGLLLDLKNVPYIDLEKPWWDQRANAQLSIGNKLFLTVSDLLIIDKDGVVAFYVNNDVIKQHFLDDPYKFVREGVWTVDKLWEMAKQVSADLNGDGILDDEDKFGLLSATHTMHTHVVGSGQFVITKDNSDLPVINITHPIIQESFDKWMEILSDRTHTLAAQDFAHRHADLWDAQLDMFAEGRGLFMFTALNRTTMARAMDFSFGILPNPKLNESQTEYHNAVHPFATTAIAVPNSVKDPERTGIILEALTAESYYTLRPAYFDVSLKNKLLRDEESGEMLEMIFATRVYDLAHVFNWGGIFTIFETLGAARSANFVSAYEKVLPAAERDMNKTIDMFMEMEP